jgi:inositol transport system ATP-binding protein
MIGITKRFSGQEVLHSVNLSIQEGEVHGLVGENGAGKSTLMKVLMGEVIGEAGTIIYRGQEIKPISPSLSLKIGIAMIHQEITAIPELTISEYLYLAREPNRYGVVNSKKQYTMAKEQLAALNLSFDPGSKLKQLSLAERQIIEAAKAASYDSKILIMDEPTSALSDSEASRLFEMIALLKRKNVSVIYITHRIEELYRIADRVTVLRDGYHVGTRITRDVTRDELVRMMVGREISEAFPRRIFDPGKVVLAVRNLSRKSEFHNISFELHEGEILGIAGLMGSGRSEIVTTLFGSRKAQGGEIFIGGEKIRQMGIKEAIRRKIALIPEDRKSQGLNLKGNVQDNALLVILRKLSLAGILNDRKGKRTAGDISAKLMIKLASLRQGVIALSGGNQQKVVLAKWLLSKPKIIILDEPTRGIDVEAKSEFYKTIGDLASAGNSLILISSELPEMMGLCDRMIVLCEGQQVGELSRSQFSQERIMAMASDKKDRAGGS